MSELKDLSEVLIVKDELPADFYTSELYDQQLDSAIEATNSLVYPLDADGEKLAKADATSINKFVRMFDKFIAATYAERAKSVTLWREGKKTKTKVLLENRQKLIDQFAEKRQEILNKISDDLGNYLAEQRTISEISAEFCGEVDFSSLIKLTGTLTPKGALTKKATDFILGIVTNEKAEQIRIEAQHLHLENRCLRAEINPPLTHIHLGTDFYAEDDIFNAKAEELVKAEIDRKAEMEARIIKQQEAKKQAEIDAALKAQQAQADANARLKMQEEQEEQEEINRQRVAKQQSTKDLAKDMGIDSEEDYRDSKPIHENKSPTPPEPVAKPTNGKHEVVITAVFKIQISNRVSDNAVRDHFISQLPEKLKSSIATVGAESA